MHLNYSSEDKHFLHYLKSESLIRFSYLTAIVLILTACTSHTPEHLITIADARDKPAQLTDNGKPGDSVGDIFTFDQPLLDVDLKIIGNNSGFCVRTRVDHSSQCLWTLTLEDGSIQIAGREYDEGTSTLSIIGGSGKFSGIRGYMDSSNNNDGTFTQTLHYRYRY